MNQSLFLHIVEKLEGFLGKLPESIQKPVLRELTPLKELFLQQRPARLLLVGTSKLPLQDLLEALNGGPVERYREVLLEIFRWQDLTLGNNGNVSLLDARGADEPALQKVRGALATQPADLVLYWEDGEMVKPPRKREIENVGALMAGSGDSSARMIGFITRQSVVASGNGRKPDAQTGEQRDKLQAALSARPILAERLITVTDLRLPDATAKDPVAPDNRAFLSLLVEHVPNQARVEMIRVSRDREAQVRIAQTLVKSTSAICAAIGAQPIPLADLPVLTTLQLVMVSGIMQLSGRERSLRAATEFLAALGANVGAGMLMREGARAVLKFFPGWGNVVCGMIAGAGTYGIGRAAIVYFLEGLSLRDARRTYLSSKKAAPRASLPGRSVTPRS